MSCCYNSYLATWLQYSLCLITFFILIFFCRFSKNVIYGLLYILTYDFHRKYFILVLKPCSWKKKFIIINCCRLWSTLWSHRRGSLRKSVLRNFVFTGKHLAQVFSCEFCKISKNTFFEEYLWKTASVVNYVFKGAVLHIV